MSGISREGKNTLETIKRGKTYNSDTNQSKAEVFHSMDSAESFRAKKKPTLSPVP